MSSKDTIDILNRLVQLHHRSLPVYLSYAAPTWGRGEEQAKETLKQIAEDATRTVDRVSEMIMDEGGSVDLGAFPMRYTALHDLSFDYLLERLIEAQKQTISAISQCVQQLSLVPMARAIAEESLGAARGHLESLEELKHPEHA